MSGGGPVLVLTAFIGALAVVLCLPPEKLEVLLWVLTPGVGVFAMGIFALELVATRRWWWHDLSRHRPHSPDIPLPPRPISPDDNNYVSRCSSASPAPRIFHEEPELPPRRPSPVVLWEWSRFTATRPPPLPPVAAPFPDPPPPVVDVVDEEVSEALAMAVRLHEAEAEHIKVCSGELVPLKRGHDQVEEEPGNILPAKRRREVEEVLSAKRRRDEEDEMEVEHDDGGTV